MRNTAQDLINDVRDLSRSSMDASKRDEMLDEVRAHLDETIRARLELGLTLEQAEAEAVASFGDPREFVMRMAQCHPPKTALPFDFRVFGIALFAVLCSSSLYYIQATRNHLDLALICAVFAVNLACAVALWKRSWRAAKPPILPLVSAYLVALTILAMWFSANYVAPSEYGAGLGLTREQLTALHIEAYGSRSALASAQEQFESELSTT